MSKFSKMFKLLRERDGYSQAAIADKLGLSRSAISMYERGEREPEYDTLELIADFFNVDVDYLLGNESRSVYYFNPQNVKLLQEAHDDPNLMALIKAGIGSKPSDIQMAISMLRRLKGDD